jgi:hypothetical protein
VLFKVARIPSRKASKGARLGRGSTPERTPGCNGLGRGLPQQRARIAAVHQGQTARYGEGIQLAYAVPREGKSGDKELPARWALEVVHAIVIFTAVAGDTGPRRAPHRGRGCAGGAWLAL